MRDLNLEQVNTWVHGSLKGKGFIQGVQVDNRKITRGDLFVCLRGEKVDGHTFAQNAVDQGAVALIVDRYLDIDVPQILVKDTLEALRLFGRLYRNSLSATFIGITGSNGKTSTKDILFSIFSRVGKTIATHANQNTEIGTYLNLFRMDYDTEYGIFEMGLDMPNDVRLMTSIVKPDAALVMSLAPTHIVNFRDEQHIAEEKFAIFAAVVNDDAKFYQGDFKLYRNLDRGYHTFGFNESNETIVSDVKSDNNGIEFKVNGTTYSCNLLGAHQASNCAGVIALARKLGVDDVDIREGLNHVALTSLRTELVEKDKSLVLLDAYKSNPISAIYAIELLKNYDYEGPRVAVLSDMVELGDNSVEHHIEVLEALEKYEVAEAYLYGPEFKQALTRYTLDNVHVHHYDTFEALYRDVQDLFKAKQMILIKGSRYYSLERLMKEA